MFLRSLYLRHFRNYKEAFFEFNPRFNLICGANAQGKTSILEAIHYLMMGRSFRASQNKELVKHETTGFYLECHFVKHGVSQSIKIALEGIERKVTYNSTALPSISSLLGIISGVVMTPDDVNLIKGAPLLRRQFLDLQIAQVDPLYVHHLMRYTRGLRQRNHLLKTKQFATISSWEEEMSHSAAYLIFQRHRAVNDLQVYCQNAYQLLTGENKTLGIKYQTNCSSSLSTKEIQVYQLQLWQKQRAKESTLGHTLTGPHKDDLSFSLDNKEVRYFASEGQQRSCMTAIHMAEWQRLSQMGNQMPLMLIDDVGLSLDQKRQALLLEHLATTGQVFLTTTEASLLSSIQQSKKIFSIHQGEIVVKEL